MRVLFRSYTNLEEYEDAVRDYQKVYQMERTRGARGLKDCLL